MHSEQPVVIKGIEIDPKLLASRPVRRCELARCQAGCCADGVWVDVAQAEEIRRHAALIQPLLPVERRDPATWFEGEHDDDPSFPSGRYTGTTAVDDATHPSGTTCVFLRPGTRFCALQSAGLEHGLGAWALKPHYCCLFPLVDEVEDEDGNALARKRLTLDDENSLFERGGGCEQPGESPGPPAFQVHAEETALALGVDGYRELCALRGVVPRL
jgi:hypothetical protein